jgi:hypothetical protein
MLFRSGGIAMSVKMENLMDQIDYSEEDLKNFFGQDPEPLFYSGWDEPIGLTYNGKDSYGNDLILELDYCERRLLIDSIGFYLRISFDWKLERIISNFKESLVLSVESEEGGSLFLIIHKDRCFWVELPYFSLGKVGFEKKPIEIDFAELNKLLKTESIVNTLEEVIYIMEDPKGRELKLLIMPRKNICLVTIRLKKGGPVLTSAKYSDVTKIGYYQKTYSWDTTIFNCIGIWGDSGKDEPIRISIDEDFSLYLPKWTWKEFRKRKGTLDD